MLRETKLNLIVLGLVVAVLSPGAVMLVKKKMKPTVRAAWMPESVRKTMAYMVPGEVPPGMERVNPERCAAWVHQLMLERSMGSVSLPVDREGLPLVSAKGSFQLLAVSRDEGLPHVVILAWDERQNETAADWSLRSGSEVIDAKYVHRESIEVPDLVREELGENGLLRPPKRVAWVEITFGSEGSGKLRVVRGGAGPEEDSLDFVQPFTK
jgi:hypothetical protein